MRIKKCINELNLYRDRVGIRILSLGKKIYLDTELTLPYRDFSDFSKSLFE